MRAYLRIILTIAMVSAALLVPSSATSAESLTVTRASAYPALKQMVRIGTSRQGRAIWAYRLGDPTKPTAIIMSAIHGDEQATWLVGRTLIHGDPIRNLNLWVIPIANPDGLARKSRYNAAGVDLNRNFPSAWRRTSRSGTAPASEPETKALMSFVQKVKPRYIVSFHQPLYGIDTSSGITTLTKRLNHYLKLPLKKFNCGGGCTGTMSQWIARTQPGQLITVELSRTPGTLVYNRYPYGTVYALFGAPVR